MIGITTGAIAAKMVKDRDMFTFTIRDWTNEPCVHKSVDSIENLINPDLSIAAGFKACPIPATSGGVYFDFLPNAFCRFGTHMGYSEIIHTHIVTMLSMECQGENHG